MYSLRVRLLPRDTLHKRGLYRGKMSVRLIVCHTPVFVKTVKHILKLFFTMWQLHYSSFFPQQRLWKYSDRDPLTRALNAGDMKKITIFDHYIALSLGNDTRYGHSYYGMRIGNRTKLSNGTILNYHA